MMFNFGGSCQSGGGTLCHCPSCEPWGPSHVLNNISQGKNNTVYIIFVPDHGSNKSRCECKPGLIKVFRLIACRKTGGDNKVKMTFFCFSSSQSPQKSSTPFLQLLVKLIYSASAPQRQIVHGGESTPNQWWDGKQPYQSETEWAPWITKKKEGKCSLSKVVQLKQRWGRLRSLTRMLQGWHGDFTCIKQSWAA